MTDQPTPMMAQYLAIREANPGALLFYRMGDFYEMFFDDAVAAAAALDIALTKRGTHQGEPIPMCGVPVHAAESYLLTLIRKGFRVAIAEQMEDPAEAKKRGSKSVVARDVVRLVTPGTLTEESLLEARRHNFLAAFATVREDSALAWVDISTGAFQVMECPLPRLAPELARLAPRELLAVDGAGLDDLATDAGAALTDLVVEDGRVVGVDAVHDGAPVRYLAERGVLLAAGGYEHNRALREQHQAPLTGEWSSAVPENTGDALAAAVAVGADTALLDEAWYAPGVVTPVGGPVFYTMVWGGVWVSSAGERFMNERLPYDRAGHELMRCHGEGGASTIPAHWVFDQRQVDAEAFTFLPVDPQVPGWFDVDRWREAGALVRADTLEELAGLIDVPADALVAPVDEYNGFARAGVDERFHRGESPWDRVVAGVVKPHTDGPNKCLGVLDAPPYYAVQVVVTDIGTKGGVRTDADARVLRADGSVIEGLYASGNTMAPALGRIYPGAGGPIGSAMVFSWLAALDMARG